MKRMILLATLFILAFATFASAQSIFFVGDYMCWDLSTQVHHSLDIRAEADWRVHAFQGPFDSMLSDDFIYPAKLLRMNFAARLKPHPSSSDSVLVGVVEIPERYFTIDDHYPLEEKIQWAAFPNMALTGRRNRTSSASFRIADHIVAYVRETMLTEVTILYFRDTLKEEMEETKALADSAFEEMGLPIVVDVLHGEGDYDLPEGYVFRVEYRPGGVVGDLGYTLEDPEDVMADPIARGDATSSQSLARVLTSSVKWQLTLGK